MVVFTDGMTRRLYAAGSRLGTNRAKQAMPASTCGHSKSATFEIAMLVVGGRETRPVLQCAASGAAAGLLDSGNQTAQLKAQNDRVVSQFEFFFL